MLFLFKKKRPNKPLERSFIRHQQDTRRSRAIDLTESGELSSIFAEALDQPGWDYAIDSKSALENAHYSAAFMGFQKPFSKEELALIDFLVDNFAGKKIATFVCGLYADQLETQNQTPQQTAQQIA